MEQGQQRRECCSQWRWWWGLFVALMCEVLMARQWARLLVENLVTHVVNQCNNRIFIVLRYLFLVLQMQL